MSLIVIFGPSGSGKTTIVNTLITKFPDKNFTKAITTTTRPPRENETNGKHYYFVENAEFEKLKGKGFLVEHTEYPKGSGYQYGLTVAELVRLLNFQGYAIVIMEENGLETLKKKLKAPIKSVFIKRSLSEIEKTISNRNCPYEEKVARIKHCRKQNKAGSLADLILFNNSTPEEAAERLCKAIEG